VLDSLYIFGLKLSWYWICNITGGLLGVLLVLFWPTGKSNQLFSRKSRLGSALWLAILYILMSKLAIVVEYMLLRGLASLGQSADIFLNYQGRWYGAILTVCRSKRYGQLFEILMIATCLSLIFGKLGCFLSGHYGCHGVGTSLPWGVTYPYGMRLVAPVHPVQLYDSLFYLILFVTLVKVKVSLVNRGWLFLISSGVYGVLIGFIRAEEILFFSLRTSQLSYLLVLTLALVFHLHDRRRTGLLV